jgi:hypothetical protein
MMTNKNLSLYETLKAAGIETDSHESDLYFPATIEALQLLEIWKRDNYPVTTNYFTNQTTGKIWIDIPFHFDPFWQSKKSGIKYTDYSK